MSADGEPSKEELESRVAELESTVKKMLPNRRDVLKAGAAGLGGAAAGGLATGSAMADASTSDSDGDVGTPSNRVDVFADGIDADTIDPINNRVQVLPGDDIQSALDTAGTDGTIEFSPGVYSVGTPLSPYDGQTLNMGMAVEFQPTGDNIVWDFANVEKVTVSPFRVTDPNNNTTSKPAVRLSSVSRSVFGYISIEGTANGLKLGPNDVLECIINIAVRDHRDKGLQVSNQIHDNYFPHVFVTAPNTTTNSGILWETNGVDGGNVFSHLIAIDNSDDGLKITDLHREMWVQTAILDVNGGSGLAINLSNRQNRGLFVNSLWTSGNANNGAFFSDENGYKPQGIQIGQHFATGNTNHSCYVDGVIDSAWGQCYYNGEGTTGYGLRFIDSSCDRLHFNHVRTLNHTTNGIDESGTVSNTTILNAEATDGIANTNIETASKTTL